MMHKDWAGNRESSEHGKGSPEIFHHLSFFFSFFPLGIYNFFYGDVPVHIFFEGFFFFFFFFPHTAGSISKAIVCICFLIWEVSVLIVIFNVRNSIVIIQAEMFWRQDGSKQNIICCFVQ